jgi:TonB family protein
MTALVLLDASRQALAQLADVSVRSVLLALVAALGIRVARLRSATARHAVWTTVLCGMLLLPVLRDVLPSIPGPVLRGIPAAVGLPSLGEYPAASEPRLLAQAEPGQAGTSRLNPPEWRTIALLLYMAIAALLLGRLLLGYSLSRKLARTSRPLRDPGLRALLESLVLGFPPPAVEESEAISIPVTVGWREPKILLPRAWREWDGQTLEAVLAHELAHLRRHDWLVALLARLNRCLFWFHPLAWWLERKLAILAEESCDDSSLLVTRNRELYAGVLLEMASAVRRAEGRLWWHATAMAKSSQVRKRIERILDDTSVLSRGLTRARWAAVLLCSLPTVYAAAALEWRSPPPSEAGQQAQRPVPPYSLDWLVEGSKLSPADAQQLERHLETNPEDLASRARLISYYFLNAMREPGLKHLFWLIEHHPESELTGIYSVGIEPRTGILNDESDYARVKELWLRKVEQHRNQPRVLANAAHFFEGSDIEAAIELWKGARRLEPLNRVWTERLANLYFPLIVAAISPDAESPQRAELAGLGERLKFDLQNSTDGPLLVMVGGKLTGYERGYQEVRKAHPELPDKPGLAAVAQFGWKLIKRAEEVGDLRVVSPAAPQPSMAQPPRPAQAAVNVAPPSRIRVGAGVQAQKLIHQVAPAYPPLARQARLQGVVRFTVIIGTDGRVQDAQLVGGHPLLTAAAHDAVREWVYQPTLVGGQPVEVITQVDVAFVISGGPANPGP